MAYGKLLKFAEKNNWCKQQIEDGQIFEAWTTYIRENDKPADEIVEDIEQEIYLERCPLTNDEKDALAYEAYDYYEIRRYE